jgi:O-antigen/teichoic acid export membrane protein
MPRRFQRADMSASSSISGRHASRDIAIQIFARVLNLALGIVVTALVARTLGDAGFGQWSTILVVVQLAAYFTSFGVESVVVRHAAAEPEREDDWIGALLVLRLLLSLPAIAIGLVAVLVVGESTAMILAGIILLAELPFNIGGSLRVVYELRVRNALPMIVLTLNSVLWAAAVVVVDVTGGGLIALAAAMTTVGAITATVQATAALRLVRPRARPSRQAIMEVARVGVPVGVAGLLVLIYARIDQLIVFSVAGSTEAGLYGAVYRIVEQAHFVPVSLMTTLAPIIAASWTVDRERMLRIARMASEYLAIGSLGGLAVSLVIAQQLTVLLYGQEFAAAASALPILAGSFVFICFGYLTGNMLLVIGLQRRLVTVGLIGLVINVVGNLLWVPSGGFMAAAWMTLITEAIVVGTTVLMVRRALHLGWPSPGRMPRIVLAALALGLGLAGLESAGLPFGWLLVSAALAYPLLLIGLGALDLRELRELLRERGASQPAY